LNRVYRFHDRSVSTTAAGSTPEAANNLVFVTEAGYNYEASF